MPSCEVTPKDCSSTVPVSPLLRQYGAIAPNWKTNVSSTLLVLALNYYFPLCTKECGKCSEIYCIYCIFTYFSPKEGKSN